MLKINTAIIGLGNIGLNYDLYEKSILTHSKSIKKNSRLKFAYGVDSSIKQRLIFEKKYLVKSFSKIKKEKFIKNISFFVISTPNKTHLDFIKKVSEFKKVKYILLEKPGGLNLSDHKKIKQICKKKNIKLYINYHRLYDKNYFKIERLLLSIKKFTGVASYSRGLLNNCSHILSFLNCLNLKKINIKILNKSKNPDFLIKFNKGQIFFFNNPRKNISNNEFEIIGDNLKIKSDDQMNKFEIFHIEKDKYIKNSKVFSPKKKIIYLDKNNSQKVVLENIFNSLSRKNISKITEISYDTFKIIDKIKSMI